tara:strand:- start:4907 stop:5041 length:135 start_codon:yes stop_codon:yes gene_type:complete
MTTCFALQQQSGNSGADYENFNVLSTVLRRTAKFAELLQLIISG